MVLTFAILARIISTTDMGVLSVLLLVVAFCQIPNSPISQAATKFIAERVSVEPGVIASVLFQSLRLILVIVVPAAAIVFLSAPILSVHLLGQLSYSNFFRLLSVDIVLACLSPICTGTLLGFRKYETIARIGTVTTVIRQILIVSLIIVLDNFIGLVVAWIIADLITSSAYLVVLLKIVGRPSFDFPVRSLLSFSWPLTVSNSLNFTQSWFDRALLIFFVPLSALGVYNATLTVYNVLILISGDMLASLLPLYSSHKERWVRLNESVRLASRYASITITPLAWGLLASAKPCLALFLGSAYVPGTVPLMIMAGAFAVLAFSPTVVQPVLLAIGETRLVSVAYIVSVLTSVGVALILLPISGILGASVARAIGTIIGATLILIFVHRKIALKLDVEAIWKSNAASIVMAVILVGVQFFAYDKFLLPVYLLMGLGIYLGMLRLLRTIKEQDVELVRLYMGRRLSFIANLMRLLVLQG